MTENVKYWKKSQVITIFHVCLSAGHRSGKFTMQSIKWGHCYVFLESTGTLHEFRPFFVFFRRLLNCQKKAKIKTEWGFTLPILYLYRSFRSCQYRNCAFISDLFVTRCCGTFREPRHLAAGKLGWKLSLAPLRINLKILILCLGFLRGFRD